MLRLDFDFDLSHAFQRIADAVEGFLAKDAEPQADAPIYCCEQMKTMLRHLAHALHFGDPAWPHIESQAQLAIQYLEVTAKSVVWGQNRPQHRRMLFDEGGLSILIRALLTYELPRSIKLFDAAWELIRQQGPQDYAASVSKHLHDHTNMSAYSYRGSMTKIRIQIEESLRWIYPKIGGI